MTVTSNFIIFVIICFDRFLRFGQDFFGIWLCTLPYQKNFLNEINVKLLLKVCTNILLLPEVELLI